MTPAQWVTDLIIRHSGPEPAGKAVAQWPDGVLRLDGAWADFPSIEAQRSGMVSDVAREPF